MTNRYEAASEKARWFLENWDEIDLAEMLASQSEKRGEANTAIERVRALHRQEYNACDWCSTNDRHVSWPCPTIRALDGEETSGA